MDVGMSTGYSVYNGPSARSSILLVRVLRYERGSSLATHPVLGFGIKADGIDPVAAFGWLGAGAELETGCCVGCCWLEGEGGAVPVAEGGVAPREFAAGCGAGIFRGYGIGARFSCCCIGSPGG